jgi:8-oxoguanine deaminase
MISEMNSAWHTHRAVKGAAAVTIEEVVRWASANGAKVLSFDDAGTIAPGKLADLAIFDLSHPRYFGLHDPLLGPVAAAGSAHLRHLIVGGRVVVDNGVIPGIDLAALRHEASRVVARLAA